MMRALMNVWEPREISADFLEMHDAELQHQTEDKGVVTIEGEGLQLCLSKTIGQGHRIQRILRQRL